MHRIDTTNATQEGEFTEGNPASGAEATEVSAAWLTAMQNEVIALIEDAGLTLDKEDNTQFLQAINAKIPDGLVPFKNSLINGAFDVWQRGKTFTKPSNGALYTADRWELFVSGFTSGSINVTREALALDAWDLPDGKPWAKYFARLSNPGGFTGAGGVFGFRQKIEGVRSFAGRQAVLSFKAKADTAVTCKISLSQYFGSGGAPSADVTLTTDVDLTTAWVKYQVPFTLGAIDGKILGTAGNDHLKAIVSIADGSGVIVDLAELQIEEGAKSTVFEQRSSQVEVALCQRYFEKSYNIDEDPGAIGNGGVESSLNAGNATGIYGSAMRFSSLKRGAPTMAWYSPTSGAIGNIRNATDGVDIAVAGTAHHNQGSTGIPSLATPLATKIVLAHWTADAEL